MSSIIPLNRGTTLHADITWPAEAMDEDALVGCTAYVTGVNAAIDDYLSVTITDAVAGELVLSLDIPGLPSDEAWVNAWGAVPASSTFQIVIAYPSGDTQSTDEIILNVA